jgi:DivIVA domain-containing protein
MQEKPMTNGQVFTRVGKLKKGYSPREVDEFMYRIQKLYEIDVVNINPLEIRNIAFSYVSNGYDCFEVDASIDRLEVSIVAKHKANVLNIYGPLAFDSDLNERLNVIYKHLTRAESSRFIRGEERELSYNIDEVDAFLNWVLKTLFPDQVKNFVKAKELKKIPNIPITPADITAAKFTPVKAANGYNETAVDALLNYIGYYFIAKNA